MPVLRTLASGTLLTHEIEIKRSRFITTLARTDTPEEARELIDAVKSEHPQARHNCSAYLIDPPDAAPTQEDAAKVTRDDRRRIPCIGSAQCLQHGCARRARRLTVIR